MRASLRWMVLLAFVTAGCGPAVDLTKGLEVVGLTTGWSDEGLVNGQQKIVPAVAFKLKNTSNQTLKALQTNALFRQKDQGEEWGSAFVVVRGSNGLAPGETTDTIVLRSTNGHTGVQPRSEMLTNEHFVDAKVELQAKYGSAQWIRLTELPIERRLLSN